MFESCELKLSIIKLIQFIFFSYINLQQQQMTQQNRKYAIGTLIEDKPGVRCDFEVECAWTWNTSIPDSFKLVTMASLAETNKTGNMSGPHSELKGKNH